MRKKLVKKFILNFLNWDEFILKNWVTNREKDKDKQNWVTNREKDKDKQM